MKFTLSILALLAIAFLVGCSAKDTSDNNKLSNSEITKLGRKYGGVYVFNKKFEKEIDDRERERRGLSQELGNKIRSNPRKIASKISEKARNLTPKCLAITLESSQNLVKNASKSFDL